MGTGPRSEDQASLPAWPSGAQPRSQGAAPTQASRWQLLQSPPTNASAGPRAPKTLGVQFWTGELDGGHSAPICTSLSHERGGDTLGSGQVEVLILAGLATTSKKMIIRSERALCTCQALMLGGLHS